MFKDKDKDLKIIGPRGSPWTRTFVEDSSVSAGYAQGFSGVLNVNWYIHRLSKQQDPYGFLA